MKGPVLWGALLLTAACGAPSNATLEEVHSGSYHLGPVDWPESQFHNSCGPYPAAVQTLEGVFLAGVDQSLNGNGALCDACALVTTRLGKSRLVRIVTTGASNAPGDMDLSPEAYADLHQDDPQGTPQNPRPITWHLAPCGSGEAIRLQYQTQANAFWSSLWVRNSNVPLATVAVKSAKHPSATPLRRGTDGTYTDDHGFGDGPFTLTLTSVDGRSVTQSFSGFAAGSLVETTMQFQ